MSILAKFSEIMAELMIEQGLSSDKLASELGLSGSSVRRWRLGSHNIYLHNAVRLAEYFNCSLEFLIGRTDVKLDFTPKTCPPFYERLRDVMEENGVTWYKIVKDGIVSDHNLSVWKKGTSPYLQSVVPIVDYLGLTVDYLVGRE